MAESSEFQSGMFCGTIIYGIIRMDEISDTYIGRGFM